MAPEERAEKIVYSIEIIRNGYGPEEKFKLAKIVAAQIREAVEIAEGAKERWWMKQQSESVKRTFELIKAEAYKEGKAEIREACSEHQYNQFSDGYKQGLEDAAKIAETIYVNGEAQLAGEGIASTIRARAKGTKRKR